MNTFEFSLEKLQQFFETDIEDLKNQNEDEIEFISQNHFGDLEIEYTVLDNKERFRLWKRLECNEGGILIEYSGILNSYTWETIYEE